MRVSNEELEEIKTLVDREHTTVSELLRDALNLVRDRCCQGAGISGNGAAHHKGKARVH